MKSIIFQAPSIKAILRGDKRMTRRILKAIPERKKILTGDTLVVREKWAAGIGFNDVMPRDLPPYAHIYYAANTEKDWEIQSDGGIVGRWRSPRYMPYSLSRLTLKIMDVDLQELQIISAEDMVKEGIIRKPNNDDGRYTIEGFEFDYADPVDAFKDFWDSVNGKGSWEKNPVVWVITFELVQR